MHVYGRILGSSVTEVSRTLKRTRRWPLFNHFLYRLSVSAVVSRG